MKHNAIPLTPDETAEDAARRIYLHGGYHGSLAHAMDAGDAFINGAHWAEAKARQLVNEPPIEHLIPRSWRSREWTGLTVCGLPARQVVYTDDPREATCNVCLANNGLPEGGVQ